MVMVNGLIMDVRTLPREVQEEAYRKRPNQSGAGQSTFDQSAADS